MSKNSKTPAAPITVPADAKERQKAIDNALSQIEKEFGKGSIMRLGEESKLDVQTISTGSLSLDLSLIHI